MIDHDPDFWPTMEEADAMLADSQAYWAEMLQKRSELYSAWQDYEEVLFRCEKCSELFLGDEALEDYESEMIYSLRCPKCKFKICNLQTQASPEEILDLATKGHQKAQQAIKSQNLNE
jgi:DNA-directed RNA polymerase subunit RPC12/RpoP